jgi:hypothetical protein
MNIMKDNPKSSSLIGFGLLGHSQKVSHVFLVGRGHLTLNPQRKGGKIWSKKSIEIPNSQNSW